MNLSRRLILIYCFGLACHAVEPLRQQNIVVMVVDDLGYSDFGCYGSEIATPAIDFLAAEGLRFRQAYVTARCCPTRASILTGAWPHQAGMGWMTRLDLGRPAYSGDLSKATPTIAEVLKPAGYRSGVFGKWHVARDSHFAKTNPDRVNWPLDRGFDYFIGINNGGSFWRKEVCENSGFVSLPEEAYLTDLIGERSATWIREQAATKQPFFAYLGFTAPHFPLHAKPEDIAAQGTRYADGWEPIRRARIQKQQTLGVFQHTVVDNAPDDAPSFTDLSPEDQADMALRMRIYAAQVTCLDANVAKIRNALAEAGVLDDTAIILISDNGGTKEEHAPGRIPADRVGRSAGSYRQPWARVSNTPFRQYKSFMHEGGIRVPCIIRWPSGMSASGGWSDQVMHAVDILPTVAGMCGAKLPAQERAVPGVWPAGRDLRAAIAGETPVPRILWFEHEGNRAIRDGDLKLVASAGAPWSLYDLGTDPCETRDLAAERPDEVDRLAKNWLEQATVLGALPLDSRTWNERIIAVEGALPGTGNGK